eukprot:2549212-Alexandrium_andersonii.AAC.1
MRGDAAMLRRRRLVAEPPRERAGEGDAEVGLGAGGVLRVGGMNVASWNALRDSFMDQCLGQRLQ